MGPWGVPSEVRECAVLAGGVRETRIRKHTWPEGWAFVADGPTVLTPPSAGPWAPPSSLLRGVCYAHKREASSLDPAFNSLRDSPEMGSLLP